MAQIPANIPNNIGQPSGQPLDIFGVNALLTQFFIAINSWIALVATRDNGQYQLPPPVHEDSSGQPGTFSYDTAYLYVCIDLNTWKRIAWGAGGW